SVVLSSSGLPNPFRALLDPEQHAALHDEVRRLPEEVVGQAPPGSGAPAPNDQPGGFLTDRLQDEGAPAFQRQHVIGLQGEHPPASFVDRAPAKAVGRSRWDEITGTQALVVRQNRIRGAISRRAPEERDEHILEPVIAVEATATVAELDEP